MKKEEIEILIKKLSDGNATPEEKLALLKELNANIESMRQDIAILKSDK